MDERLLMDGIMMGSQETDGQCVCVFVCRDGALIRAAM